MKKRSNLRKAPAIMASSLGILFPAALTAPAHADFTLVMRKVTNGVGIDNTTDAETLLAQPSSPGGGWEFEDFTEDPNPLTIDVGGGGSFSPTAPLPNGNQGDDRYALRATANLVIPAGTWTIGFGSDDGGSIKIPGITFSSRFNNSGTFDNNEVRWETGRGHTWTGGTFTVATDLTTTIEAIQYENTGGDSWEIGFAPGAETGFNGNWALLADGVEGWTVQVAPINDTEPPTIASTDPADDSVDAFPGGDLVATFSEEVAFTGLGTITVTDTTDGSGTFTIDLTALPDADADVSISGTTLTIDPTVDLDFSTDYEVSISSDAIEDTWTSPNAFAGTGSGDWTFTTAAQDFTAPLVTALDPADESTSISPATDLTVTFDDDVRLTDGTTQELLNEDFGSGDGGFTVSHTEGTTWAFGTPDSSGPGGTITGGNSGTEAWATGLGDFNGTGGTNGFFEDPTTTALRSPVIDLTGFGSAELSFAEALDLEGGDTAVVNIIDDTTDSVIAAAIYTATDNDINAVDWASVGPISIPAAALGQPVRIEWSFSGLGGDTNDYMGWYVDDVLVTGVDSSGVITLEDLGSGDAITIPSDDASQLSVSGNTLTINPGSTLNGGANYAVRIGSAVLTNLSGLPFAGISDTTVWNFTTSAVTTLTGTEVSSGNDTWNNPANWDAGVPTGVLQAIIADSVSATAEDAATPTYSGGLIFEAGSSLDIRDTAGSENAIGTGPITFEAGSTLILRSSVDNITIPGDIEFAGDALITNQSNATDNEERYLTGNITGPGLFTYELRRGNILHLDGTNTWSGGFVGTNVDNNVNNTSRIQPGDSGFGTGDVTINDQIRLEILSGLTDTIDDGATLHLNGVGLNNGIKLEIDSDETVGFAFRDGNPLQPGTWGEIGNGTTTYEADWIGGSGILTVSGIAPDTTPPTIVEFGAPAAPATIFGLPTIPITVSFDEEVDPATVDASDFSNAGTAPASIGDVTLLTATPAPSVYEVEVVPSGAGTVQLSVSGTIEDFAGNSLVVPVDDPTVFTLDTTPQPAKEVITIDDVGTGLNGNGDVSITFDASASDKLVVVVGGEHGFNNAAGTCNSVTYDGVELTPLIERDALAAGTDTIFNHIWYLDDPGSVHTAGAIVAECVTRGTLTAFALSGTAPGAGTTVIGEPYSREASLITTTDDSLIIASFGVGGAGNTGQTSGIDPDAPLIEQSAQTNNNRGWDGTVTGTAIVPTASLFTASFSGGNSDGAHVIAAEFLAADATGGGDPYGDWADGFPGLTDSNPELDFDGGGLDTGVEWVVGGDPTDPSDDASLLPTIDTTTSPGDLLFIFRRTAAAGADANTTIQVEYGSDLLTWTSAEEGTNGVSIAVDPDGFGSGVDKVTATLPVDLAADGRLFARLNVQIAVP